MNATSGTSPRSFGKYDVVRLLGRGGMAEVYEARDRLLGRRVAVKVIHRHLAADAGFEERFRREARLVASLRHPHIVRLLDYDVVDEQPFMVMEYLDGGTLADRLAEWRARGEILPLGEIARLLDPLASALDLAHAQGAVHRDLKPANILFTASGEPVLGDFGIAKVLSETSAVSVTGSIVGTPAYLSPEQAADRPLDGRSDQYSLGVVLYEMAAGRVPFEAESATGVLMKHLNESPPPPRQYNPALPPAVEAVILKALAKNPEARFGRAGELARAWQAALLGEAPADDAPAAAVGATLVDERPSATPAPAPPSPPAAPAPPQPSPPAEPPAHRPPAWLAGLAKVASVFAPLVGREAPTVSKPIRDRRSLLAALLGIAGVLLASLQFVIQVFDVFATKGQTVLKALPYLAVAALAVGGALALVGALRADSPAQRRRAAVAFGLIAAAGLAWGAWAAFDRFSPARGFIVSIADFDGTQATRKVDFARRIFEQLQAELSEVGEAVAVERAAETYPDAETARKRGQASKATLVIWGWYDDAGVSPHVEVLDPPASRREAVEVPLALGAVGAGGPSAPPAIGLDDVSRFVRIPAALPDFDLFVRDGPQQMTYISAALLGVAFYLEGDAEHALQLLDKALANAPSGAAAGMDMVYFHRAALLYDADRLEEAAADLEAAIAIHPDLFEAHYNLALTYADLCTPQRQLDRALAAAQTAVALRPRDASAHRLLGDLYRQAGQDEQAIVELETAQRLDADDTASLTLLADAYAAVGKDDLAAATREQAIRLSRADAASESGDAFAARMNLGDALLSAGRYADARTEYRAAQSLSPDDPSVHRGLGDVYYWTGEFDQAEAEYRAWAEAAPEAAAPHLTLGLLWLEQGETDRAVAELRQAGALSACSPSAHLVLGGVYWRQGDYAKAAAEYQAALTVVPSDADALYLLGGSRYLQGDLDAAAEALAAAVALREDFAQVHFALGKVYFDRGDFEAAAGEWALAAEAAPDDPVSLVALADAYEKLGRLDDAVAAYQAALALGDDADTRVYLGLVYARQGDLAQAIEEYRAAIALDAQHLLAYAALGDAYAGRGEWQAAAEAYRQGLEAGDHPLLHTGLAGALSRLGQTQSAIAEYEAALALDGQLAFARLALAQLYLQSGPLEKAEAQFRAVLDLDAASAEAHAGLSTAAYKGCNAQTMAREAESALSLSPDSRLYQMLLASAYEAQGRPDEAADIYAAMQAAPPADVVAHLLAGDFLFRTGQFDSAADELQAVLSASGAPGFFASAAHDQLGQMAFLQGDLDGARDHFADALTALPINADAQAWLGDVALAEADAAAALAAYEQAAALLPDFAAQVSADSAALLAVQLEMRRGLAHSRLGAAGDAARAFGRALAQAESLAGELPRWPLTHLLLAQAHEVRGDAAQAEAERKSAVECDRSLASAWERFEAYLAAVR